MGPKRFKSQNISLFIVKLKKLGFSALLIYFVLHHSLVTAENDYNKDLIFLFPS